MRRALTIVLLLALMGAFAFGVNRFFASRKHTVSNATTPTASKPAFSLPGTMYVVQDGNLYRLHGGAFANLHLPAVAGTWMQPAAVPGTHDLVAVARSAAYSDVYLLDDSGHILKQLSHNATNSKTIQLNHWMFWPRVAADGDTFWVSYDAPKNSNSFEIELAVWRGSLSGNITSLQWTVPNGYTGGDVDPIPLAGGGVLYSKYQIANGQVYSQIAIQRSAQADPVLLTNATDDCSQPALSADGAMLAMICTGGTGLQNTRLQVATLQGTTLGTPQVLVSKCLCAAPAWAPDGSGLVYFNPADATGHFQLWWIAGAGGPTPKAPKQVTTNLDFDATSPPVWIQ